MNFSPVEIKGCEDNILFHCQKNSFYFSWNQHISEKMSEPTKNKYDDVHWNQHGNTRIRR